MTKCKHGVDERFCALCNKVARAPGKKRTSVRHGSATPTIHRPDEMHARDVLASGEKAVAIFTRGDRFTLNADGTGVTGNWKLNPARTVDKVVIYRQDARGHQHEIFVGVPVEIVDSAEDGRREIRMADIRFAGVTGCNWNEFTDTNPGSINPVMYVHA
jgi:hypothetical protein